MRNLNVNIKIAEAKDLIEGRIGDKYLGSLDYSLLTDYIEGEEDLKDIIKEVDGVRYSDDIISVNFNYEWMSEEYEKFEILKGFVKGLKECHKLNVYKPVYIVERIVFYDTIEEVVKFKISELARGLLGAKIKFTNNYLEFVKKEIEDMRDGDEKALKKERRMIEKNIKKPIHKKHKEQINKLRKEKRKCKRECIKFNEQERLDELVNKRNEEVEEAINFSGVLRLIDLSLENIKERTAEFKKIAKDKVMLENLKSTADLRKHLYKEGFIIGDKHYVRFIRSSGAARVGKCLFINKEYYDKIMKWIYAGIDVAGQEIDLAGFESYISLVASGSVGRFKLDAKNILLIDDYYSKFLNDEDAMVTRLINKEYNDKNEITSGDLETTREKLNISNNIFDGQSLLDLSIYKETEILREKESLKDKATLQVRNKFFKGQAVRTDLKQFYIDYCRENKLDYNTYKVKDMFGSEMFIKDILMVTTPSSLKYLKYFKDKKEGYNKWKEVADSSWAICKYDKPTHHFEGMSQTHYQLLNSLGLSKDKMRELLKDTIDYINLLKIDGNVFKYNVNIREEINDDFIINSKDKMIKALLTWNDDFIKTQVCINYRKEIVNNYIENVRCGHVLVEGNYSIAISNPIEMLYASVGDLIEGKDRLEIKNKTDVKLNGYESISNKFDNVEEFAAVRSPQPSMANVGVFKNRKCPNNAYYKELSKYFNVESKEVIFVNSINVNSMEKFSSMDFDIDALLVTNNKIIVEHAKEIQHFPVNNDMTEKAPVLLKRNAVNLSETDIKCGQSKIGEVINLVQHLNSVYWDSIHNNKTHKELEELYKDISQLNSLSCIEIDKCKKTSPVNTTRELEKIKGKGHFKEGVKPNFMKWCNEYEAPSGQKVKEPTYVTYNAGMDYLEEILTTDIINLRKNKNKKYKIEPINLSTILKKAQGEANRGTVNKVIGLMNNYFNDISKVYKDKTISKNDKDLKAYEIELECAKDEAIVQKLKDKRVIYTIIKRCEKYEKYTREIAKIKRSLGKESDVNKRNELIAELDKFNKLREKVMKFKNFRRILKIIFLIDRSILVEIMKEKAPTNEKKPYVLYGHEKLI